MVYAKLFRVHGEFCARHPWEVIVAHVAVMASILAFDKKGSGGSMFLHVGDDGLKNSCPSWRYGRTVSEGMTNCENGEQHLIDVILMMVVRGSAILYIYYHFCNLQKLRSTFILGLAGLFTVFSSFMFISNALNILGCEVSDLKDALFLFLLLIDLSKAGLLAQMALCGRNRSEVTRNIADGMEFLGPALTLDTIVETLVIGVGTLSGVQRLELLSWFAVVSALVNYIVFMTFYPAILSLILDLENSNQRLERYGRENLIRCGLFEEDRNPNPVAQSVKLLMSSGLFVVHVLSRFVTSGKDSDPGDQIISSHTHEHLASLNETETNQISEFIMRWMSISLEQIGTYLLIFGLGVKFYLFDRNTMNELVQNQQAAAAAAAATAAPVAAAPAESAPSTPSFFLDASPLVSLEDKATQSELSLISREERIRRWERKRSVRRSDCLLDSEEEDEEDEQTDNEHEMEREPRPLEECIRILQEEGGGKLLTDAEVEMTVRAGYCPLYKIESVLGDAVRGVKLRRIIVLKNACRNPNTLNDLPYLNYDYSKVMNACCENVLGVVPIPLGYAGPLLLDGKKFFVPMATTEGALVASTNRGCKALSIRGVTSFVEDVGMTRAPCVRFPNVLTAAQAKRWMESSDNFQRIKEAFDSSSRYARLQDLHIAIDGPVLYIRFRAFTGDAMGMNMLSKGTELALRELQTVFPQMEIISLSGNFCSDKKPAAINWIKGRGKRVVCEATVPADKLAAIFKTTTHALVRCNKLKNQTGSAVAGTMGGNNAHAANMVTAIYLATGQDPAQNVTSSNCSTNMEPCGENGDDLYITCTMPSLEVGTLGGGTGLPGQSACLDMLGVRGSHPTHPAENSKQLARIICATVMAGELSLLAALVTNDLVKSHMRHNRSSVAVNPNVVPPASATMKPATVGK